MPKTQTATEYIAAEWCNRHPLSVLPEDILEQEALKLRTIGRRSTGIDPRLLDILKLRYLLYFQFDYDYFLLILKGKKGAPAARRSLVQQFIRSVPNSYPGLRDACLRDLAELNLGTEPEDLAIICAQI